MATGDKGGGSFWGAPAKVVPTQALGRSQRTPVVGRTTGPDPVTGLLGAAAHFIGNPLAPSHATLTDPATGRVMPVNAPTFFTPATAAAQTLLTAPAQIGAAHAEAVKIAHAKQAPSLSGDVNALLSGALGFPRGGVNEPHPDFRAALAARLARDKLAGPFYHGTHAAFTTFDPAQAKIAIEMGQAPVLWATESPELAAAHAPWNGANVHQFYIRENAIIDHSGSGSGRVKSGPNGEKVITFRDPSAVVPASKLHADVKAETVRPSLAGMLRGETGSVSPGAFARGPYRPRVLGHNELEAQLPKARSRITNVGERLVDKASAALQSAPHVQNIPGARLVTAGERVAKAAGRQQRIERGRADAAVMEHINAIKSVRRGSPEDRANFWYAQLPKAYRNAEGLSLVKDKQAGELQYLTSGKALEDLAARESAIKAQMAAVREDPKQALPFLKDLEDIKLLRSDIPSRIQDTAASISELEKLAAKAPSENVAATNAVHALSNIRAGILTEGGRLNPEKVEPRKGLVSRWLGLEPTGEEGYLGHRLPKPEAFKGSFSPSGGTGRVKSPQGVGTENKLVLARNGRLRQSLHVALEDHASAHVFDQANVARGDLGKLGSEFPGYVPKGHVLVNPKGVTIPAHWKTPELAQFHDNYSDTEAIRKQAEEIVSGFVADNPRAHEQMINSALEKGMNLSDLRVVPKRLVDRYYSQFRSAKSRGTALKAYDSLVDATATSIVFARVGYIPKNFVQNLIMAVPHQGPMLLVNATRAAQALADPELRHFFHAEVGGTGATGSLGDQMMLKKVTGKIVGGVSKAADDPARFSAFMHEAAAAGVVSRVNPLLTEKDRANLIRLFTDKSQRPLLNDIRSRTVEAMADFSRMTPDQARVSRRFLIIPGWLMAGTRYPFHFALTHPIRSALLAYIAAGEPGAPKGLQFNKPVNQYFSGSGYKQGIDTPWGRLRTNSISPVSTPWDLGQAAVGTIRGKTGPFDFNTPTVFDSAQPLAGAIINIAQGGGVKKSLQRLAPGEKFVEQMINPKASSTYPEDASRLGRLKREIGILPIQVNDSSTKASKVAGGFWGGTSGGGGSSFWGGSSGSSSSFWGK